MSYPRLHLRKVTLLATAIILVAPLSACSAQATPTCSEYAEMASDTGLLSTRSSDQTDALKDALDKEGYDDGLSNQLIGHTDVLAYCNIYDGVANQNQDQPITAAL